MPTELSDAPGPFARNAPAQARVRAAIREAGLRAPGVVAGEIATFDRTEALLARRDADLVASARQTLCDPDGFEKARLGLDNQVLRCLFTNYCEALDQRHRAVTCQRWDRLELDTPGVRTVPGDDARPGPRRRATAPTRQPAAEGSAQLMNEEATR
jgi:hypothetical protein